MTEQQWSNLPALTHKNSALNLGAGLLLECNWCCAVWGRAAEGRIIASLHVDATDSSCCQQLPSVSRWFGLELQMMLVSACSGCLRHQPPSATFCGAKLAFSEGIPNRIRDAVNNSWLPL